MFYTRLELDNIRKHLLKEEITLIVGARQIGKTSILHELQKELNSKNENTFFINLENVDYLLLLNDHPHNLFKIIPPINPEKKYYVFIDEVQYLRNPTNFLKLIYDEYKENIKLIVSGSSSFYIDKKFKDSLAGRKRIFILYSLNFRNFLIFRHKDELLKYLPERYDPQNYETLANVPEIIKKEILFLFNEYSIYGGYPRVALEPDVTEKQYVLEELVNSYIKKDLLESNIRHYEIYYRLLKILASQTGQLVNTHELAKTLKVSTTIINNYLYIMRKSFHLALIKPYFKNIRKELTKMPKAFFYDSGLRNYLLNNFLSIATRDDKGAALENITFKQFLSNFDPEKIRFWRTQDKKEMDFVVDEKYAFEVKYNYERVKKKNIDIFKAAYPDMETAIVSIEDFTNLDTIPVWAVWGV